MKNKIVLLILIILITPFSVKANSITINCDTNTVKDNDLSCEIKGNSLGQVIAVTSKITTGNNISFANFIPSSIWQGNGEEGKIDLYTDKDIKGEFLIGTVNFNVNQIKEGYDSSIILNNIFFYDVKGKEVSVNSYTKNIRIASTDNDLSSLSLNNGSLNPSFSSNITTYSTTINVDSVVVSASAHSKYAKVTGDTGKKNLSYGNNNFKVNVTSESGNTKTYTINIIRPDNRSTSNNNSKNTNKKTNTNTDKKEEITNKEELKEKQTEEKKEEVKLDSNDTDDNQIEENNILDNNNVITTNKGNKFNDKKIKNIFITIIMILLIINGIRIMVSGINMKRGSTNE